MLADALSGLRSRVGLKCLSVRDERSRTWRVILTRFSGERSGKSTSVHRSLVSFKEITCPFETNQRFPRQNSGFERRSFEKHRRDSRIRPRDGQNQGRDGSVGTVRCRSHRLKTGFPDQGPADPGLESAQQEHLLRLPVFD